MVVALALGAWLLVSVMVGMAVGIDYSLFIVSRYREERKKGFARLDAIGASASRFHVASGTIVAS